IDGPERVRADAFVECPIVHPTLMARADVLRALGYRDLEWPEDYDLVLRMLAKGHRVGMVPRRLVGWRESPTRLWRRDRRYGLGRSGAVDDPCGARRDRVSRAARLRLRCVRVLPASRRAAPD